MSTSIISIATAPPEFQIKQSDVADIISNQIDKNIAYADKVQRLFCKSGISNRNGVVPATDWDKSYTGERIFFNRNADDSNVPKISDRIAYHEEKDVILASIAMDDCLSKVGMNVNEITHLITVTTTGVRCPGLDADLSKHYGLKSSVERFHIHFGGCHAGMQALRQANYICKSQKDAVVMVVCVEFNTLYYKDIKTKEQLVISLLFGDGVCATLLVNEEKRADKNIPGFIINTAHSVTLPNTSDGVQIRFDSEGLDSSISPKLSDYINESLPDIVKTNLWLKDMDKTDVDYWAVHPGGKRILNTVAECLGIEKNDLCFSYEVLNNYGNMGSASIIYVLLGVWNAFLKSGKSSANIAAIGCGPGVTVEMMIMESVCPEACLNSKAAECVGVVSFSNL